MSIDIDGADAEKHKRFFTAVEKTQRAFGELGKLSAMEVSDGMIELSKSTTAKMQSTFGDFRSEVSATAAAWRCGEATASSY